MRFKPVTSVGGRMLMWKFAASLIGFLRMIKRKRGTTQSTLDSFGPS